MLIVGGTTSVGHLVDLVGLRRVLDQLQHLVAEHDPARRGGDVLAHGEPGAVDHLGNARCRDQVLGQLPASAHQAQPRGVDHRLGRGRVDQRDVAGSARLDEVLQEEPHPFAVTGLDVGVVHQLLDGLSAGQVELDQPLQHRVLGPGDVVEPAVRPLRHHG